MALPTHTHIYDMLGIIEVGPVAGTFDHAAKKTPHPANSVTKVLVPLALNNAAILHSLLAYSSSLMDARSGCKTGSTTTLVHTVNAIRLINESMNDTRQATSNEILSSIIIVSGSNVCRRATSLKITFACILLTLRSVCLKIMQVTKSIWMGFTGS
jgi:hypothetical protein